MLFSIAVPQHLVHQTALERDDAVAVGIQLGERPREQVLDPCDPSGANSVGMPLHLVVAKYTAAVLVDAKVADERVGVVDGHVLEVDAQVRAELLNANLADRKSVV